MSPLTGKVIMLWNSKLPSSDKTVNWDEPTWNELLISCQTQTISLMTGEGYSLERSLTSLRLIDWALNHRGLRGLQGLAWSDRTSASERETEGEVENARERGPFGKWAVHRELCSSLMEPHQGQSVSQSGESRSNGVLMKTASHQVVLKLPS